MFVLAVLIYFFVYAFKKVHQSGRLTVFVNYDYNISIIYIQQIMVLVHTICLIVALKRLKGVAIVSCMLRKSILVERRTFLGF